MNVQTLVSPTPAYSTFNLYNLGIISYGDNNLYPQELRGIVGCSDSGSTCLNRMIQFVQGNGFDNTEFSQMVVNRDGDTVDDLQSLLSADVATYGGGAIHINYYDDGTKSELFHIPFENTRLTIENEDGLIEKIAIFEDWSGTRKRGNKILRPTKETIDYIHRYNPDKVFEQIDEAGGIEFYKGQVLWFSNNGKNEYPTPIYNSVVTWMSTEEGLANISYRNSRCNFLPASIIVLKNGLNTTSQNNNDNQTEDVEYQEIQRVNQEIQSFQGAIRQAQGDTNANSVVVMSVKDDTEIPIKVDLMGENYDSKFTITTDTACENIYASFGQEVWHRLRKGGLGFSGDIMKDAYDVYSSTTGVERRMLERIFKKAFEYWHDPISENVFTIQPLVYVTETNEIA